MDVTERIAAGLPADLADLARDGPEDVAQLWLLARAYSRLRHQTSARPGRMRLEALKAHCVRRALAREPGLFFVFVDPSWPHLWLIYHRVERNLLHVPVTIDLPRAMS
jgi:hypothetical protein